MYKEYQLFVLLLKIDLFFFVGFTIQFLVLVLNKDDSEFILTIIAIPVTVLVLLLAVYAVSVRRSFLCHDMV